VGSLPYGRMPNVMAVSSTPAPSAKVRLPSQSMRALRVLAISLSDLYAQTAPNRPNGRLTQKIARQSQAASRPPSSRPTNCPLVVVATYKHNSGCLPVSNYYSG